MNIKLFMRRVCFIPIIRYISLHYEVCFEMHGRLEMGTQTGPLSGSEVLVLNCPVLND